MTTGNNYNSYCAGADADAEALEHEMRLLRAQIRDLYAAMREMAQRMEKLEQIAIAERVIASGHVGD